MLEADRTPLRWSSRFERSDIWTGRLHRQGSEGLRGALSTWASMEAAVLGGGDYTDEIARAARDGASAPEILDTLRFEDARWALGALAHEDRFLLLEPDPVEDEASALYRAATALLSAVDRPEAGVLLPSTPAGFEAGAALLGEGTSVAFDPVLSPRQLEGALEAHAIGIAHATRLGLDPSSLRTFAIAPLDRVAELAQEAGRSSGPTPEATASALDDALRRAAEIPALDNFRLLGPGFAHGRWIPEAAAPPLDAPEVPPYAWTPTIEPAVHALALAERATASRVARARLLEAIEEQRARALAACLTRPEIGPLELRVHAQARVQTWPGDEREVVARAEEGLELIELFCDLQAELADAEVEEILWVSTALDAAPARAWHQSFGQLDGHPELVFATPATLEDALAGLSEASVAVLCGLDDDRGVAPAARAVLGALGPEQVIVAARVGSQLEHLAEKAGVLARFEPLSDTPTAIDLFPFTAALPAILAGAEVETLLTEAQAMLGSCHPELPAAAHAGAQLATALRTFVELGGRTLEVVTSPAFAGFGPWLAAQPLLDELGLAVAPEGDGAVILALDEEPGFALPPPGEERLRVVIQVHERTQLMQEMLRWTIALELAARMTLE